MDRYVVLEYLAEGGMGAIYRGKKLGAGGFEKEVVLKQLLPEFTQQPEFIDLFLREARLTAALDHANIVHTIDLVRAADEYFIVMEYVRGGDLRTLLKRAKKRKRRMSPAAALFIAREVLSALSYAHQKVGPNGRPMGLIHRDVSPSNILVSGAGEVKLTDFGIAKATTHRSVFYRVKGKIGYMSPEQARGQPLQPRSDLYSAGVVLYEMLTGERLLVGVSITTSADEMYSQPVPGVSQKVPGLPRELDAIMFRALKVDPDQRYQTAGEFQEALLRAAHRNGLMMGAADLSRHLLELCGSISEWGTTVVPVGESREGTNVDEELAGLAGHGTEPIPALELGEPAAVSAPPHAPPQPAPPQPAPPQPAPPQPAPPQPVLAQAAARASTAETAAVIDAALDDAATSASDVDEDLLWVDELARSGTEPPPAQPLRHRRTETHNETGRLSSIELTSVIAADLEKFASERVEHLGTAPVSTGRSRIRGRVLLVAALLLVTGVGVALAIGFTGPNLQSTNVAAPAPAPKPPRPPPPPPPAKLVVESDPPKARVLVEGQARCTTPCTLDGIPASAPVLVRLERDGYLPWIALVQAADPAQATQRAKLRRDPASAGARSPWGLVSIRSASPGNVLVNGKPVGWVTSAGPLPLPAGDAVVAVAGQKSEAKITVKAGATTQVELPSP
jgi:eukaryotic-like serine/threonine-protein kinase